MSTAAPADAVPAQVRRTADLLRALARADQAESILALLSAPRRATPSVYVAGEAKAGKSSLVNALLGLPGLSPVGVEPTTAVPVSFSFSDEALASVFRYGDPDPQAMGAEEALRLATTAGNPGNEENVRGVSVGIASPLLRELLLVDTPGVGGLDSGHGALTMQALANAQALVFVTSAVAPLRAPELDFLRRASSRIETVVIVMAKVDTSRGWRTILEADRSIIAEQAPRFARCPILPVSSQLALRGLRSPDPADARELRDESGITALEAFLATSVVARADVLQSANLVRATVGPLVTLERSLTEEAGALATPIAARDTLLAEQKRLQQLNLDRADWPQTLDGDIRKLTLERQDAASRQTIELRHRYEERLKTLSGKEHDDLPGEFIADLTALASSLNEVASVRLAEIVQGIVSGLDGSSALAETIDRLTRRSLEEQLSTLSVGSHALTHFEKLTALTSFSAGRSVAQLMSGSGLGLTATAFIAPPVALALGFGIGSLFVFQTFRHRNRQAFAAEFGPWMRDQIANAVLTINNEFARAMVDFQAAAKKAIRQALSEREREINAALAEAKRLAELEAGERTKEREVLIQRLAEVRTLKQETLGLLAQLAQSQAGPS